MTMFLQKPQGYSDAADNKTYLSITNFDIYNS